MPIYERLQRAFQGRNVRFGEQARLEFYIVRRRAIGDDFVQIPEPFLRE